MQSKSYRGLYVQRLKNGRIFSVHVALPGSRRGIAFSPEDYEARGIQPPLKELPAEAEYFAGQEHHQSSNADDDATDEVKVIDTSVG